MTPEKTAILKINKGIYEGYLWYSNDNYPRIVLEHEEYELELKATENPFIIEGHLFDGTNSISIKYVDGGYIITHHTVKAEDFSDKYIDKVTFLAKRMKKSNTKLKFLRYWEPEHDDMCERMSVLRPTKLVFIGFNTEEK